MPVRMPVRPIHLTFDDGPDAEFTPRVLELLSASEIHATFFIIGALAARLPALVRSIEADGHEIGNHTYNHPHPRFLGAARARREVAEGAAAIADILGKPPRLFRAPHGTRNPAMLAEAARQGETVIHWDVSAIDWGPFARSRAIAKRLGSVGPGDIVLMHDGGRGINRPDRLLEVLPAFLDRLAADKLSTGLLPLES